MDVVAIFNAKLSSLANELVAICPDVPDFAMLRNAIKLAINLNPKVPVQYFGTFVAKPYGDFIRTRDERFFLSHTYDDVNVTLDVVEKIKGVWNTFDDHNKDVVWKYFEVLLTLNDACVDNESTA